MSRPKNYVCCWVDEDGEHYDFFAKDDLIEHLASQQSQYDTFEDCLVFSKYSNKIFDFEEDVYKEIAKEDEGYEESDPELQYYSIYLDDWFKNHHEGTPVCIDEFLNNEFTDKDYMKNILNENEFSMYVIDYDEWLMTHDSYAWE